MCPSTHGYFQNGIPSTELHAEFSQSKVASQLNALFSNDAAPCMLVENDCSCTAMMISSVTDCVDKTTG